MSDCTDLLREAESLLSIAITDDPAWLEDARALTDKINTLLDRKEDDL